MQYYRNYTNYLNNPITSTKQSGYLKQNNLINKLFLEDTIQMVTSKFSTKIKITKSNITFIFQNYPQHLDISLTNPDPILAIKLFKSLCRRLQTRDTNPYVVNNSLKQLVALKQDMHLHYNTTVLSGYKSATLIYTLSDTKGNYLLYPDSYTASEIYNNELIIRFNKQKHSPILSKPQYNQIKDALTNYLKTNNKSSLTDKIQSLLNQSILTKTKRK